jgi:pimeloyl-ACP methyl ester carboxylesterase
MNDDIRMVDRGDGTLLACAWRDGAGPVVLFLPGYMSDMLGTKAVALDRWAAGHGRSCLRFDYSGSGRSEGRFADGSIRRWAADAAAVVAAVVPDGRPLVLVGSSMGGWIMLHLALRWGRRVAGLVGVAAAPDFSRWGLALAPADAAALAATGRIERANPYGPEPTIFSATFLADAHTALLLDAPVAIDCPVRLLHGQRDAEVPWTIALDLAAAITGADVRTILVKDGDHRLSRPADIALLLAEVAALA